MADPSLDASAEPTLPELNNIPSSPPAAAAKGTSKRSAPSLLPAFEPLSSSPGLPRPLKRQNTGGNVRAKYPTPLPTSSTAIMSSSPPRQQRRPQQPKHHRSSSRSPFVRTSSRTVEREPLSALPTVDLPENGEVLMMGRSSNSSHFQLSANRLVSRVHVKARYIASPNRPDSAAASGGKVEIVCNGWNGLKVHCQGRTWELLKGDTFTSETEGTGIMLEVQDSRVLIQWPSRRGASAAAASAAALDSLSDDSAWDDTNILPQSSPPLRRTLRIHSPESPTSAHLAATSSQRLQALFPSSSIAGGSRRGSRDDNIQIYEDEEEQVQDAEQEGDEDGDRMDVNTSMCTDITASFSSELSDPASDDGGHEDPDEENDPIVHSFGPFGADISGRLASIMSGSPEAKGSPASRAAQRTRRDSETSLTPLRDETPSPPSPSPVRRKQQKKAGSEKEGQKESRKTVKQEEEEEQDEKPAAPPVDASIVNHAINQLAFSRLSSTPLSTIMQHLPADAKVGLTRPSLLAAIESTACIGIIERQGKDAAGEALESEYYYVPERDTDESRRAAVVDGLRKPTLRNCRKQHKQYYWKRPRTP
ncbi:transcription factor Tos4 [Geosmithia morbida]|uniref:Transcription factor Tos4 n=1 Tax=Geosmithia morbida TaxID=1094350 RepID=A0A9P4YWK4_9HYPO|nr:transcription factor Tos4 [Geosmithia morbida]KAF4123084.1 transcription factor Tos4 [Geosmithia morbida]